MNEKEQTIEEQVEQSRDEEREFRAMVPDDGFFAHYMEYTDKQESPGSFHFWVGATILGACLQRKIWVSKGIYNVYPNLFTVLVAPSGKCRKSRAISLGTDLISKFEWLNLIADKTSPEALLKALMIGTSNMETEAKKGNKGAGIQFNTDNTGIIKASELSVFLNRQTYTSGMVSLLTDLYDCGESFKYITRNKTPIVLRNIAVQMLGGSTPDWLATSLPESAFGGGFMSRIIFMVKHHRDRYITFPREAEPYEAKEMQQMILKMRAQIRGKMVLEHEARDWFDMWYRKMSMEAVSDTNLLGFIERKPDTILKVATILAVSELRQNITQEDLHRAFDIVSWTQARAFKAFMHVELSSLGKLRYKLLEFLDYKGGQARRREVLRKFGGTLTNGVSDLKNLEDMMTQAGELKISSSKHKNGSTSIIYTKV